MMISFSETRRVNSPRRIRARSTVIRD
ncbi:hypothetical protein TSAR_006985 [Trichomalopsis sarcophagae]|uniref:Uncharacterized protein n=1 Tax=Trichomalopsis sarcophagae TaxID=543379 RepID=A0A232EXY7_9HYME|nr:hypothetical protein TSAR_006985 [Trichomalopsis sarcophagae]